MLCTEGLICIQTFHISIHKNTKSSKDIRASLTPPESLPFLKLHQNLISNAISRGVNPYWKCIVYSDKRVKFGYPHKKYYYLAFVFDICSFINHKLDDRVRDPFAECVHERRIASLIDKINQ